MSNWTEMRSRPLSGPEHRLSGAQIHAWQAEYPQWHVDGHELVREFGFDNYYQTIAFVNALAFIAHAEDHHPDLSVHYNKVIVRFSTHDVGGLSNNDLICAAKLSKLSDSAV